MKPLIILILILSFTGIHAQSQFIPGYENPIKGESMTYHSPQEDAGSAILVRSECSDNFLEWETAIVPENYENDFVCFSLMMAMDVNSEDAHKWELSVNSIKLFDITSPKDTLKKIIKIKGNENSEFHFSSTRVDKYGDLIGYLNLRIPTKLVKKGERCKIRITGENAGSRTWLMIYKYKMQPAFSIRPENAIRKGKSGGERVVKLETVYYKENAIAKIKLGENTIQQTLSYGYNCSFATFSASKKDQDIPYTIIIDGNVFDQGKITLKPIQPMTIFLIHHSHVDIGYTHVQTEVEQKQWNYIEQCIELAENSQSYPPEARFKWNIEVMWALDSYWEKASKEQKEKLKNAIQKGWIELDAFYANELTGLCTSEELIHLMEPAQNIAQKCNVNLNSAMISDIPGWTWGIIPVLQQAGVKYLSLGTNTFHRIGYTIEEWGDKPFYWESASGKEKILTWIHGKGYSSFHTGLGAENIVNKLDEEILLTYMNELRDKQYPYNKVILRYNIGSDNGPPDNMLSEKVQNWNEMYETPKLIISTTSEAFGDFEKSYGENLPVIKGDFSGYWEDGAASSAKETSINRNAAHTLCQAQTLYAISGKEFPTDNFRNSWKKIMLYNEHTWGSWNSISEPLADFTKQQWAYKRTFSLDAKREADSLKNEAIKTKTNENSKYFDIINTHSWAVSNVVKISAQQAKDFNAVKDKNGKIIKSQKLQDGSLVFISDQIPAFSSKRYKLLKSKAVNTKNKIENTEKLLNSNIEITLDKSTGNIKEFIWENNNLVSDKLFKGLNQYIYIEGRNANNRFYAKHPEIKHKESGDILNSITVSYKIAKGCKQLQSTYTLYHDINRLDIVNHIDKSLIFEQEGVHFAFPFNIPEGKIMYDLAYGVCEPNIHQIKGSNKNFITIENWLDLSNNEGGITWISRDAPLVELGDIHNDPTVMGYIKQLPETQIFLSYVMNNYWETNYLAAQEGQTEFRYSIIPHRKTSSAFSERKALEVQQELIAVAVDKNSKPLSLNLSIDNENIIIQSIIPIGNNEYILRLFNAGNQKENLKWDKQPANIKLCNSSGEIISNDTQQIELLPMELCHIICNL